MSIETQVEKDKEGGKSRKGKRRDWMICQWVARKGGMKRDEKSEMYCYSLGMKRETEREGEKDKLWMLSE